MNTPGSTFREDRADVVNSGTAPRRNLGHSLIEPGVTKPGGVTGAIRRRRSMPRKRGKRRLKN